MSNELREVWCCTLKHECKWQHGSMSRGLAWGTIPPQSEIWRQWHDRECNGELVQLISEHAADGEFEKFAEEVAYCKSQLDTRPKWTKADYEDFYDRDVNGLIAIAERLLAVLKVNRKAVQ